MCPDEPLAVPDGEPAANAGTHWTYDRPTSTDLSQGDLLAKTPALRRVLEQWHPHYNLKEDYTHFLVLTQTCDLVRRDGAPCSSRYISIAAVRPLDVAVRRMLEEHQGPFEKVANACSLKNWPKAEQFVRRVLNNNEPEYFYLHEDVGLGLGQNSCAFLQLSVALRAGEHYATCLEARLASLREVFRAKLGWLVGNLYSRVGTEDWVPDHESKREFSERVTRLLKDACVWFEDEQLKAASKTIDPPVLAARDLKAARAHITATRRATRKEKVLAAVERVLRDAANAPPSVDVGKIMTMLKNDPELTTFLK